MHKSISHTLPHFFSPIDLGIFSTPIYIKVVGLTGFSWMSLCQGINRLGFFVYHYTGKNNKLWWKKNRREEKTQQQQALEKHLQTVFHEFCIDIVEFV